jgi:hypothetical protein
MTSTRTGPFADCSLVRAVLQGRQKWKVRSDLAKAERLEAAAPRQMEGATLAAELVARSAIPVEEALKQHAKYSLCKRHQPHISTRLNLASLHVIISFVRHQDDTFRSDFHISG